MELCIHIGAVEGRSMEDVEPVSYLHDTILDRPATKISVSICTFKCCTATCIDLAHGSHEANVAKRHLYLSSPPKRQQLAYQTDGAHIQWITGHHENSPMLIRARS